MALTGLPSWKGARWVCAPQSSSAAMRSGERITPFRIAGHFHIEGAVGALRIAAAHILQPVLDEAHAGGPDAMAR